MQKNDDLDSFYRTIMLGDIDNNTFEEYFQIFAHIHGSRIMVGGLRLLYCFITYINYLFYFFVCSTKLTPSECARTQHELNQYFSTMGQCSSGASQWHYNELHGYLQGITKRQYK